MPRQWRPAGALLVALCALAARADVTPLVVHGRRGAAARQARAGVGPRRGGREGHGHVRRAKRFAATAPDGRWMVFLEPLARPVKARNSPSPGRTPSRLRGVVVGEVWLCSGQSNMEWPVSRAAHAEAEIAAANFPLLRHVRIEHTVGELPADAVTTGGWQRRRRRRSAGSPPSAISSRARFTKNSACPWASSTVRGAARRSRHG